MAGDPRERGSYRAASGSGGRVRIDNGHTRHDGDMWVRPVTQYHAIILDPGHGGLDPSTGEYQTAGKRYTHTDVEPPWTYYEGVHNRRHAALLARMLIGLGVRVFSSVDQRELTQPPDADGTSFSWRDVSLAGRTRYANDVHGKLAAAGKNVAFVSMHGNAIGSLLKGSSLTAHGLVVFTSRGKTKSDELAESITDAYRADPSLGFHIRDPKEASFHVLNRTRCPAVLIEAGFFTNLADAQRMASQDGSEAIARGVFRGLMPYLKVS